MVPAIRDGTKALLTSFDGTETVSATVTRPESHRDLAACLAPGRPIIARGSGLSYAAASMGEGALSVDMTRFDRFLSFDPQTGVVRVEPGVQIGDLTALLAGKGRYLPVLPGYPDITVGGCVAFDVHGKSQFHSGNFGDWVEELELMHPDHGTLTCNRRNNADVFALTIGGFGLTGVITAVSLRTEALPGASVRVEPVRVANLLAAVELMQARADDVDCVYSWHNLNRAASFGSGVVYLERFVSDATTEMPARRRFAIAARMPVVLWSRLTTPLIMRAYQLKEQGARAQVRGLRRALFPIEGLEHYYAAFGRRGFREYQVIVPAQSWPAFVAQLQTIVARMAVPITLASLKLFRGSGRHLAFSGAGVCLAIDVPASPNAVALFAALDDLALAHGAVLNISKDSRIDGELCRRIFPGYQAFGAALTSFDPNRRCQSRLRGRLGV